MDLNTEYIHTCREKIRSDLEQLRSGHIRELANIPGVPKCSTLANRISDNVKQITDEYEKAIQKQARETEEEDFRLLAGLLGRIYREIADLSKKQPDVLINPFKVQQINRVLDPLKDMMLDEPSFEYLDLVQEVEDGRDKSRNSYSDAVVILSQYIEACDKYRKKHFGLL